MAEINVQSSGTGAEAGLADPYVATTPESRTLSSGSYAANCKLHLPVDEAGGPLEDVAGSNNFGAGAVTTYQDSQLPPDSVYTGYWNGTDIKSLASAATGAGKTEFSHEAIFVPTDNPDIGWGVASRRVSDISNHGQYRGYAGGLQVKNDGAGNFHMGYAVFKPALTFYNDTGTADINKYKTNDIVHLLVTLASGTLTFYVNGVQTFTVSAAGTFGISENRDWGIGGFPGFTAYNMIGNVCHVAYWDIALDPSDFIVAGGGGGILGARAMDGGMNEMQGGMI